MYPGPHGVGRPCLDARPWVPGHPWASWVHPGLLAGPAVPGCAARVHAGSSRCLVGLSSARPLIRLTLHTSRSDSQPGRPEAGQTLRCAGESILAFGQNCSL